MRAMIHVSGILCLALRYVCAQQTGDAGVSIPPLKHAVTSIEIEPVHFIALPPSPSDDGAPTDATPPSVAKKASGKKVAVDESSSSSPGSSSPVPTSSPSSTPERDSTSESFNSQAHTSNKAHHPHTDAGQANTHKILPSHLPSLPSPETPPNHPLPPPHIMPHHDISPSSKGLSATAIAFIVLGAVFGLFLAYIGARCCYSWRRVPEPDRINDVLSRHFLDREMEEREREDIHRRWILFRSSVASPTPYVPPPPPYIHAPSYEDVTPPPSPTAAERV